MSPQDSQKEEKMNNNDMENNGKGKGKKKTTQISAGGDIGGLVVVGGALVIGGLLMAIFASKRNKTRDSNDKNPTTAATKVSQRSNGGWLKKREDHGSQGLRCLLQTSSSVALRLSSSSCAGHGSSTMGVITQVNRLTTESDGTRISEMVLPDSQEKEIIKLSDDFGAVQDEKYDNEDPVPTEITDEVKNSEETSSADQDSDMHSAEDGEDEEESVAENDNEGSDDTGHSSMESNTDTVWPAEMIEDTMPELEEASQPQRSGKEYKTGQTEKPTRFNSASVFNNKASEENMTINRQISKLWVRLLTLLMLVLYFLLIYPIPRKALSAVLLLFS
ncbi:uncharacterized protein LOC21394401 isoform X2 [Morus notabilis]|uniref:uncharacterized protein LOC21394401 isoform X2 n=1 Tax=Morus notabilis TaxID=981085 RepID=UPI000CECEE69|nr:uncharacterized protein LOC21394401 isoform X2 [Morus notabilis]